MGFWGFGVLGLWESGVNRKIDLRKHTGSHIFLEDVSWNWTELQPRVHTYGKFENFLPYSHLIPSHDLSQQIVARIEIVPQSAIKQSNQFD